MLVIHRVVTCVRCHELIDTRQYDSKEIPITINYFSSLCPYCGSANISHQIIIKEMTAQS